MRLQLFRGNNRKDLETRFTTFSEQLAQAFAQIKTDISEVKDGIEANQQEVERMGQWIGYLNRSNQRISDAHSELLAKYGEMADNHQKLHTSHSELSLEHDRTSEQAQKAAETASRMAETLENSHEKLSNTILGHKENIHNELKSEFKDRLQEHKDYSEEELKRMKSWIDYLTNQLNAYKRNEGALKQDIEKIEQGWLERYSSLRTALNGLESENSELKSDVSMMTRELDHAKNELRSTITELETTRDDIKNMEDLTKNHVLQAKSELSQQIEELRELAEKVKIEASEAKNARPAPQAPQPAPIPAPQPQPIQPIQPVVQQVSASTPFQRHIMSRVMPNRKGYVIKFIMDLVKESKFSTKEVEEIVVNEKQLCGRTSFYAYLKELKLKGRLGYAEIDERTILVSTDSQQTLMDGLADRVE